TTVHFKSGIRDHIDEQVDVAVRSTVYTGTTLAGDPYARSCFDAARDSYSERFGMAYLAGAITRRARSATRHAGTVTGAADFRRVDGHAAISALEGLLDRD